MTSPHQIRLEVIPAVDLLGGQVVRLRQGDYDEVTLYGSDPVAACLRWHDQGAGRVHVVDLEGARRGLVDLRLWESLAAAGVRFQAGGGIRSVDTARQVLDCGADRVVMGTAAVWAGHTLSALGERVVAAVDVRAGVATGSGWLDEGRQLPDVLDELAGAGVSRLLVTGISRDGMLSGPDLTLTATMVSDRRFSVIASGGVSTLEDLDDLAAVGCEAAVVGRALYDGRFSLEEARIRMAGP